MRLRLPWRHWNLEALTPPWGSLPSAFDCVTRAGGARPGSLPDEDEVYKPGELRWAPGAMDGVMSHHGGAGDDEKSASPVAPYYGEIVALLEDASSENLDRVYASLKASPCLYYVDDLLGMVVANQASLDVERLTQFAVFLARRAPHREAVKIGISLLGCCGSARDLDLVIALGAHDEFTLFAAIAAARLSDDPETALFRMAQSVHGWGRIHIVERLAGTERPDIRHWMLREGFHNEVMDEYLAAVCARTGRLAEALAAPAVDVPLLDGAAGILRALLAGGPAEGIADYVEAPQAVDHYVNKAWATPDASCLHYLALHDLAQYLTDNSRFDEPARERLLATISDVLTRPAWHAKVERGLASADRLEFAHADEVARHLGVDTWQIHFDRVRRDGLAAADWFSLLRESDDGRIDPVLAFAQTVIPLDRIATGPANELGVGPGWEAHSTLDWILQELRRFPTRGWVFLKAGLQSPVVRNRNMAMYALSRWPRADWPAEAVPLLERVLGAEPDDNVRQELKSLLDGEPLELD